MIYEIEHNKIQQNNSQYCRYNEQVQRLAVCMGSDGVSEVGAGAGGRVGGMVNETSLALGSIAQLSWYAFQTGSKCGEGWSLAVCV